MNIKGILVIDINYGVQVRNEKVQEVFAEINLERHCDECFFLHLQVFLGHLQNLK